MVVHWTLRIDTLPAVILFSIGRHAAHQSSTENIVGMVSLSVTRVGRPRPDGRRIARLVGAKRIAIDLTRAADSDGLPTLSFIDGVSANVER